MWQRNEKIRSHLKTVEITDCAYRNKGDQIFTSYNEKMSTLELQLLELKTLEQLLYINRFHEAREDILEINGKTQFLRKKLEKTTYIL